MITCIGICSLLSVEPNGLHKIIDEVRYLLVTDEVKSRTPRPAQYWIQPIRAVDGPRCQSILFHAALVPAARRTCCQAHLFFIFNHLLDNSHPCDRLIIITIPQRYRHSDSLLSVGSSSHIVTFEARASLDRIVIHYSPRFRFRVVVSHQGCAASSGTFLAVQLGKGLTCNTIIPRIL